MHALDELLVLYRGRDPEARRYFLSCMADLKPSFDTDVLVDFLWHEVASPDAAVGRAARRELGRVLPEALRHGHALTRSARSVWSDYFGREQLERYLTDQALAAASDAELAPLASAAFRALEPALARAVPLMASPDPRLRTVASLVMGQWQAPAAVAALVARLEAEPAAAEAAAALAEHGSEEATHALLEHVRRHWREQVDLLGLLGRASSPRALPALERIVPATSAEGRTAIALSLGANKVPGARDLLHRLAGWREGWVIAGALKSMTAHPGAADLKVVQEVSARERHGFLRSQAVRTAGWLPGAEALAFLKEALAEPEPRVQAAAIEGLARQKLAPAELAEAGRALLASPLLKTRVNAVLALARSAPEECTGGIQALLFADSNAERLEGAYVLGYVAGGESASALATMAGSDPDPAVRLQAFKSLARQPARIALDHLLALFVRGDATLAPLAAQAIGDLDGLEPALVEERLGQVLSEDETRPGRAVAVRALGRVAARTMVSAPPVLLMRYLDDSDPAMVRAALSGLRLLGDRVAGPAVAQLVQLDDARLRAGASAVAFLGGDLAAVQPLADLLASGDEAAVKAGLNTLLELTILVPAALRSARFLGLRAAVTPPAVEAASAEVAPPAPSAPSNKVPAPVAWEPTPAPINLAGTGKRLEQRYTKKQAAAPRKPVDRAAVEALSYLADLPKSVGRVTGFLRTYGGLLAAPLVLFATLVFALQRPATTAQGMAAPPPPGTFVVRKVVGGVTALRPDLPAGPLKARDRVGPGSTVNTGPGAEIEMADTDGSLVWLGPDSMIEVASPPALLRAPAGDVVITFRDRSALDVATPAGVLKLEKAMVRIRTADSGLTASVLAGQASWVARGEVPVSGGPGATLDMKSPGAR